VFSSLDSNVGALVNLRNFSLVLPLNSWDLPFSLSLVLAFKIFSLLRSLVPLQVTTRLREIYTSNMRRMATGSVPEAARR